MDPILKTGMRWLWWGLLFGLTLEVSARVDDRIRWSAPFFGRYEHEALITRDSVTLRGRPGYRYEKWAMNSNGFRGPELSDDMRRVRIITLGASETFGLFESPGQEYPAQLQRMLDSLAPGSYEVVNAALPGMSLAAMRPYLRTVLAPLQPDFVVLYPTPSFFLEPSPPPDSLRLPPWAPPSQPSLQERLAFEITHPRLKEKAKVVIKRLLPSEVLLRIRERRLVQRRAAEKPDWVWTSVPTDRMDLFERQLERVMGDVESLGATPVLVTHANRFLHRDGSLSVDDRQHLQAAVSSYWPRASDAVAIGVDSAANRRVQALGLRNGVIVVDAEGSVPPDAQHFADYSHFTDEGARRMASLIVRALERISMFPGGTDR
jgi:lysophospholipase L1-like esterase